MRRFSRFVNSQTKQTTYSPSRSSSDDAGLRTRSGLVAGYKCEIREFVDCVDQCNGDLLCVQKCSADCK